MTTSALLLPERFHQKNKRKTEEKGTAKLPAPTGWRILIMPYTPPKITEGGIELPDETHERERLAVNVGLVMAVGPLAYKDENKFGGTEPWCKEKDWIIFSRYAGSRIRIDGGELRLLNDDEVLAVVDDPSHLVYT